MIPQMAPVPCLLSCSSVLDPPSVQSHPISALLYFLPLAGIRKKQRRKITSQPFHNFLFFYFKSSILIPYIFRSYNILPLFSHLLCYLEHLWPSFVQLKRFIPLFPVSIVSNCYRSFCQPIFLSVFCSCTSSVPSLCHLLNGNFFPLTASCTSSFHYHVSLSLCFISVSSLPTDLPCGTQQCI